MVTNRKVVLVRKRRERFPRKMAHKDIIPVPVGSAGSNNPVYSSSKTKSMDMETLSFPRSSSLIPPMATTRNQILLAAFTCFASASQTMFGFSGPFIYISQLKMNPLWIPVVGAICSIFSIMSQIFIAYYGDTVQTRWGRRKPIILVLFPIIAFICIAAVNPPLTLSPIQAQVWYLVCNLTVTIAGTCYGSVFQAWFIESCADQDDYRRVLTLGITVPSGVGSLVGVGMVASQMSPVAVVISSVFATIFVGAVLWYLPSRIVEKASKQPPLLSSVRVLSNSKEYRTVLVNKTVILTAFNCGTEFLVYAAFLCFPITHYQEMLKYYIIFALMNTVGSIVMAVIINCLLAKRWEKVNMYLGLTKFFVFLAGVFFAIYLPTLVSDLSYSSGMSLFFVWLVTVIITIFLFGGAMFLDGLIVRDLIRYDTFRTGLNRENMYQTALGVPSGILSQFVSAIPLCIVTSTGLHGLPPSANDDRYTSKYQWDKGSQVQVAIYSTFIMAVGMYAAYYLFSRYPIRQNIASKVEDAIAKREQRRLAKENSAKFGTTAIATATAMAGGLAATDEAADTYAGRLSTSISTGIGSIADDEDEMLMNHFSFSELQAMSISENNANKRSVAVGRIAFYSRFNLFFVSPACMASILAGFAKQIMSGGQFTVIVVNLFLVACLFAGYEALRYLPISQLLESPGMDVMLKAKAACRKITEHQDTLKELLDRNGIETEDPLGVRESLASPPLTENGLEMSTINAGAVGRSYLTIYIAQAVIFVIGMLFTFVIHE